MNKKNILAIVGSASANSSNLKLVEKIVTTTQDTFNITIYDRLKLLPHFDPELSTNNPPDSIVNFRNLIAQSDGVIICTPEYVFSIPSGLKNAIEWCIATTVFSEKPCGLITASASGEKGHEELQLIMKTAMAKFTNETAWLIQGVKSKIDENGNITNTTTNEHFHLFINAFKQLVNA